MLLPDAIAALERTLPAPMVTPRDVRCNAEGETCCQTLQHCTTLQVQDFRDERELCEVCAKTEHRCKAREKPKSPLLECDKCLRAFHADCCKPPIKTIPQVSSPSLFEMLMRQVHLHGRPIRPQARHVMHLLIIQRQRKEAGDEGSIG